ncbi:MAG: LPS assembly lipoprotein LptE [Pseudomonadota bacterium]
MLLFDRRSVFPVLAASLAASCGFAPVYGTGDALRGQVRLGTPTSANAFALVRALEFRLGALEEPRFDLAVDVDLDEEGSVITRTSEIDRFTITGRAAYVLTSLGGDAVTSGTSRASASYSASSTPMATRASRSDAQGRLMEMLADDIVADLARAAATI